MQTLTIKDLSRSETLDGKAMAAVQGGMKKGSSPYPSFWMPSYDLSRHEKSVTAEQVIGQNQEVFNANGNNAAFVHGINSTVKPTQTATNNIFA